jgi:iron-sulfur cluster repair protein YtfE (RIC family)
MTMRLESSARVAEWVVQSQRQHVDLLGMLPRLRALASETDFAEIDQRMGMLCNDLRECFAREESMVFPILLRFAEQTRISACKAGAIKARLRFMIAEQNAAANAVEQIISIIRRRLSPDGPCESCHELLRVLQPFEAVLHFHFRREQDELFAWAIEREEHLIRRLDP